MVTQMKKVEDHRTKWEIRDSCSRYRVFNDRANAPTNNYRVQEKKIRIRNKKGDFYGTDIWLIPK